MFWQHGRALAPSARNAVWWQKNIPATSCFNIFAFQTAFSPQPGANFADLNFRPTKAITLASHLEKAPLWLSNHPCCSMVQNLVRSLAAFVGTKFLSCRSPKIWEKLSRNFYPPKLHFVARLPRISDVPSLVAHQSWIASKFQYIPSRKLYRLLNILRWRS